MRMKDYIGQKYLCQLVIFWVVFPCVPDYKNDDIVIFYLLILFIIPQAEHMIKHVRTTFMQNLMSVKWMDNKTMEAAVLKAESITEMIGGYWG